MSPNLLLPSVYRASVRPTCHDLQSFAEFLRHASDRSEKDLQHLLERHPALVGVLGYCEFISEHPIFKKDKFNKAILDDARRRDRADLVAAKHAPPTIDNARHYKSAHILELKRANLPIAARDVGSRLSDDANTAVGQLKEYKRWITTIPENERLLNKMGWDVRAPALTLIMGRDSEFADNPGQLEEVRGILRDQGVILFTLDDVFRAAEERIRTLDLVLPVTAWAAPQLITACDALKLIVRIDPFRGAELFSYPPAARSRKHGSQGYTDVRSYLPWLRDEFDFRCVFCLVREAWGWVAGGFVADCLVPASLRPELRLDYDNLVYSCFACNAGKASTPLAKIPTAEDIRPNADGTLRALSADGEITIEVLSLNRQPRVEYRRHWMKIGELAFQHDRELFERTSSWPTDVPDLLQMRPPGGNARPAGLSNCYWAQRQFSPGNTGWRAS